MGARFAELAARSKSSFLDGASHSEDQVEAGNFVVHPDVAARDRAALVAGRLLVAEGRVEREAERAEVPVTHLIVRRLTDRPDLLDGLAALEATAPDHTTGRGGGSAWAERALGRADEVRRPEPGGRGSPGGQAAGKPRLPLRPAPPDGAARRRLGGHESHRSMSAASGAYLGGGAARSGGGTPRLRKPAPMPMPLVDRASAASARPQGEEAERKRRGRREAPLPRARAATQGCVGWRLPRPARAPVAPLPRRAGPAAVGKHPAD